MTPKRFSRRGLLATAAALPFAAPMVLRAQEAQDEPLVPNPEDLIPGTARNNVSSFRTMAWQDHFDSLGQGAIVCDMVSRVLHFWSGDGEIYRLYPTSVPRSDDLTKRGYSEIVRKKVGPTWTPTASMHERFDDLPKVMPAGPDNPLGTHAMYLDWPAYLIHGTHDTRKIGRRSSDGCIGLYNEKIAELFELAPIGTQVRLI